tara:strand:- start:614 stop:958 length:345 start_codon:yes stop_codon:yes gene_type:complete
MVVRLETKEIGDVLIIKVLDQRIKFEQSDDFGVQLRKDLDIYNPKKLLLNLEEVVFMSSNTLGMLVSVHKQITNAGGQVKIVLVSKTVLDVFKITNLHKIFKVYNDEHDALNDF